MVINRIWYFIQWPRQMGHEIMGGPARWATNIRVSLCGPVAHPNAIVYYEIKNNAKTFFFLL